MDDRRHAPAPAEKVAGAIVLCIGLAGLAVLAFAARKVASLERAVDPGDLLVLGVLAAFACFCAALGWYLLHTPPAPVTPSAPAGDAAPARRVTASRACAAAGVLLLILSVLVPAHWQPVAFFFGGLALLAVSHGLAPCVERIEQLRRARASERQL
jgi:hypothetical protein